MRRVSLEAQRKIGKDPRFAGMSTTSLKGFLGIVCVRPSRVEGLSGVVEAIRHLFGRVRRVVQKRPSKARPRVASGRFV